MAGRPKQTDLSILDYRLSIGLGFGLADLLVKTLVGNVWDRVRGRYGAGS